MNEPPGPALLDKLITGYCISQAIYVAAELGVADRLASGPRHFTEVAAEIGAHERSLYRLLRALASIGIFAEDGDGRFRAHSHGRIVAQRCSELTANNDSNDGGTILRGVGWAQLTVFARAGPAFESIHGQSFFDHLADHPKQAEIFDDAMTVRNDRKTRAMLDVYDLTGVGVLADIGGGNGSTLVTVLTRYPEMRGLLFDRPGVVERARAGIERAGLSDRCQTVGGSFLERVPDGADAYLLAISSTTGMTNTRS